MTASLEPAGAQRRARRAFRAAFLNPQDHALLDHIRRLTAQAHGQAPLFAPHIDSVLEFERLLGEGGMGTVHCVFDHRLGRRAAFKMIRRDQLDDDNIQRFARELLITARLNHPGIPPVYDAGMNADGDLFMLMRLIEGRSLDQVLAEKKPADPRAARLRLRELVSILIRAAEAVAFAHEQGVIHRDLKPQNIMIGAFGEVLVLDWGLALDNADLQESTSAARGETPLSEASPLPEELGAELTQAGVVVGTLGYMPPEQARKETLDERADVFGLGAVLTTMLTGAPPISVEGGVMDRLKATVKGEVRRPRELAGGLPPDLEAIAARATNPARARRHRTVPDLIASLQAWLDGAPVPEYRPTLYERQRRWIAGHPIAVVSTIFTVLALTLAAAAFSESRRARQEAAARQRFADGLSLMAEARDLARRRRPLTEIKAAVSSLMATAEPSEALFVEIAQIYRDVGALSEAERVLRRAERRFRPAFRALFARHILETRDVPEGSVGSSKALSELRDLAPADSEDPYVLFARADGAAAAKDWRRAIELYDRLERRAIGFPSLCNNRGDCRFKLGDRRGAEADFTAAIADNPQDHRAYTNRSLMRFLDKRYRESLDDAEKAISIAPRNAVAHFRRGCALFFLRDHEAAVRAFDRCLELDPRYAMGYANRARARVMLQRFEEAREDYDRAIELEPRNPRRYLDRAAFLLNRGVTEATRREGREDLLRARELAPEDPRVKRALRAAGLGG